MMRSLPPEGGWAVAAGACALEDPGGGVPGHAGVEEEPGGGARRHGRDRLQDLRGNLVGVALRVRAAVFEVATIAIVDEAMGDSDRSGETNESGQIAFTSSAASLGLQGKATSRITRRSGMSSPM